MWFRRKLMKIRKGNGMFDGNKGGRVTKRKGQMCHVTCDWIPQGRILTKCHMVY